MPTIILTRLTCNETEDNTGADEANLRIWADGSYQSLTKSMDNGDSWDLNVFLTFETRVKIQLYDLDNPGFPLYDDHDHLGTVIITPEQAGEPGNGTFTQDGASYEIEWVPANREVIDALRVVKSPKGLGKKGALTHKPEITKNDDGTLEMRVKLTPDEAKELKNDISDKGSRSSRKTYCCFCHEDHRYKEIKAWNSVEASLKCGLECGGGFTMHRGECEDTEPE